MKALVSDLISALPEERREPLKRHQKRFDSTIVRSFADPEEQLEAAAEDRQGLAFRAVIRLPKPSPTHRWSAKAAHDGNSHRGQTSGD